MQRFGGQLIHFGSYYTIFVQYFQLLFGRILLGNVVQKSRRAQKQDTLRQIQHCHSAHHVRNRHRMPIALFRHRPCQRDAQRLQFFFRKLKHAATPPSFHHLRNIPSGSHRLTHLRRGDFKRFCHKLSYHGTVFAPIAGNGGNNFLVQCLVRLPTHINGIAQFKYLPRLVPCVQCQKHIRAAQKKQSVPLTGKLSQRIHRVAHSPAAYLHIRHNYALHAAEGKLTHAQSVARVVPRLKHLVRRNPRRYHIQNIQPHLLHKSACRPNMSHVNRSEGSAVYSNSH